MINYTCPICKQILIRNNNSLTCTAHGEFDSINNIPILVTDVKNNEFKYFQKHWQKTVNEELAQSKLTTAANFLDYPVSKLETLKKKLIFDAGCGDGVHINYLNETVSSECEIYGSDLSLPALWKAISDYPTCNLSCSDILNLPYESNVFDISFSFGVIAYTANPRKAFEEICRVTKEGGLIGVWFYPKPSLFKHAILQFVRRLSTNYNQIFANFLANLIIPFLYVLPTASKVNLSNATWKQCKEVVLVNIAPPTLWYPTEEDITRLYEQNNISVVFKSQQNKITIWGIKK